LALDSNNTLWIGTEGFEGKCNNKKSKAEALLFIIFTKPRLS